MLIPPTVQKHAFGDRGIGDSKLTLGGGVCGCLSYMVALQGVSKTLSYSKAVKTWQYNYLTGPYLSAHTAENCAHGHFHTKIGLLALRLFL